MKPKKTLVLGASGNPSRYSHLAIQRLRSHGHPVVAIGRRMARVADTDISTVRPIVDDIDTVTMYMNEKTPGRVPRLHTFPQTQKDHFQPWCGK